MLNIYYGAETADKEKFIFENIKGRTLLLVPDQFSLQAERDAFFYLKKKSLMDLRIVDFSTLGHKVVQEVGGAKPNLINKYGSQMLFTKILGEVNDRLKVYRGMEWKSSFIDMIYGTVSDMKRYGVTPENIKEILDDLDDNSYLKYKLEDIALIYEEYQSLIEGKYLDAEDYILFYGEKILRAPMVIESEVWIYGFDTFTPKNFLIIERLLKAAKSVNVVLTYEEDNEIFDLTKHVMNQLVEMAEELNEEVRIKSIDEGTRKEDLPITMVSATNMYTEAERAAAYVMELVRNHGYRYGDIAVVCNDMETRGNILRRTFTGWGIPVFIDKKRKVMHHPAVSCLLAVMDIVSKGYRTEAVMKMIKSGLMGFSHEEAELLENYAEEFKIRGNMWTSDFNRTGGKYGAEELNDLNRLRLVVVDTVKKAKETIGRYNTASEKTKGLYSFLEKDFAMKERIEALMERQEAGGFSEAAAETAQSWDVICNILDQIVEILGDEKVSNKELTKLMTIGFERVEIGLVPISTDRIIMGTLQRTRMSRIKALIITGANSGILPMENSAEELISDREKVLLQDRHNIEISKKESVMRKEEALAIYRAFHLPEDRLYISCSETNREGEPLRPSEVFRNVKEYVAAKGEAEVLSDLGGNGDVFEMLTCRSGTLGYLTDALRQYATGGEIDDKWLQILSWYEENRPEELKKVKAGMMFDNRMEAIGGDFAEALYKGERAQLEVSASRLEKYSNCPFAHFVMYGLRAESPMVFEMGAREIGNIYHYCLMKLSGRLMPPEGSNIDINSPQSPWMTITEKGCRQQIEDIMFNDMEGFREGLLDSGNAEKYRIGRITDICSNAAWAMIKQVRKGNIKAMFFEQPFGRGEFLPAIKVDAGGKDVYIKGKIDRFDLLAEDGVRIVDYKTGQDTVNLDYIRSGYKLQLMVYLKAATGQSLKPAGAFYYKIAELDDDADKVKVSGSKDDQRGNLAERLDKAYKLVGIVLDDEKLIGAMDCDMAAGASKGSAVLPVKPEAKDKEGLKASSGSYLLKQEEFGELMEQVDAQVQRICEEICDGKINIIPKKEKKKNFGEYMTACKYCEYKSICMFDTSLEGCEYDRI